MKTLSNVLIALALALPAVTVAATSPYGDASVCYVISDTDARLYCLAKAHHDRSRCYGISDQGKRAICLAEVR